MLKGEAAIKKACEDLLKTERIRYWRMQAGNLIIPGRGRVRLNGKGTPDLLAAPYLSCRVTLCPHKRTKVFLWIECKASGKMPSKEQFEFADEARRNDEFWLLVDDVKTLQEWLRDNRAR